MNADEAGQILILANALDPRIQVNKPTRDLWAKVLHAQAFTASHAAVNLFYERYADPTNRPVIDAPSIRRIIAQETERAIAKTNAIEAGPRQTRNPLSYRQRNPELWDRRYEQGRAQRAADLANR